MIGNVKISGVKVMLKVCGLGHLVSPAPSRPVQQEPASQPSQIPEMPVSEPATESAPASASINFTDTLDSICEKVGESLRLEITSAMGNLKAFLANELRKSEARTNIVVEALKSEVATLKNDLTASNSKVAGLEATVRDMKKATHNIASAPAPVPAYDTVIAGDSIVKHCNVNELEGNNKLICLPGARCFAVHRAVSAFTKTATVKNLVLHLGTNHVPLQSPAGVATEIANTLKRVQLELPNTKIFFSAILPKYDASMNPAINFINSCIRGLCRVNGFGYIAHGDFCTQNIFNEKLFSPSEWRWGEPVHPSHDGVKTLMRDIRQSVAV